MLLPIDLGMDLDSRKRVLLPGESLSRHAQLLGASGTGKTVGAHALVRPIMAEPRNKAAVFIIDPLGGLSRDLLSWIASPKCPSHVRQRLVYVEAANNDVTLPFNPLQMAVGDDLYYHVARTVDLMLRAWTAQDLASQPRLLQWSYAAMMAIAATGQPISHCQYLLQPGSAEHKALIRSLPPLLQAQWNEILQAKGSEPTRILESTRNRWYPLYSAPQTRRMFGVPQGRLDVERMIRERRIVIINVAKMGKVSEMLGETIGSLVLNEIFETAFKMAAVHGRRSVDPTVVLLDEFQKFISPDIEDALPTLRQTGLKLILAHQSFSQLVKGDMDLRSMIFQAQNRFLFANNYEDADIVANELAVMSFDANRIKEEIFQRKQLIAGHRTEWLVSEGVSNTIANSTVDQSCVGFNNTTNVSRNMEPEEDTLRGRGTSEGTGNTNSQTTGTTRAVSESRTSSRSQTRVPIYDNFKELSSKTYTSFDEQRLEWMKIVRQLKTGHCFGKFVDDDRLHRIHVKYEPVPETARTEARVAELVQRNYEQDFFISSAEADRQGELARLKLLEQPKIIVKTDGGSVDGTRNISSQEPKGPDPFQRPSSDS